VKAPRPSGILDRLSEARSDTREHVRRDYLAGRRAAEGLGRGLNGGSRDTVMLGLLDGLRNEHRYLQGEAVWTILQALSYLGADPLRTYVDGRNEHAIRACEDIRARLVDRTGIQ